MCISSDFQNVSYEHFIKNCLFSIEYTLATTTVSLDPKPLSGSESERLALQLASFLAIL